MSNDQRFDANRRLAEVALWVDESARWIDRATKATRTDAGRTVTVVFPRNEYESFLSGFHRISNTLLGLAPPVPPVPSSAGATKRLRLVEGTGQHEG